VCVCVCGSDFREHLIGSMSRKLLFTWEIIICIVNCYLHREAEGWSERPRGALGKHFNV
jgi:hypothetical protein